MIGARRFLRSVLDTDLTQDVLLVASDAGAATMDGNDASFTISMVRKRPLPGELYFDQDQPSDRKLLCASSLYPGTGPGLLPGRTAPLPLLDLWLAGRSSGLEPDG